MINAKVKTQKAAKTLHIYYDGTIIIIILVLSLLVAAVAVVLLGTGAKHLLRTWPACTELQTWHGLIEN